MNHILILTIIAAAALGLARVFLKLGSGVLHPFLSLFIIYITFAAVAFILFGANFNAIRETFQFDRASFIFLILAALVLAVFDIAAIYVFKGGGRVAIFAPVTAGGSVLVAMLAGIIFLGEKITLLQIGGAALTAVGVVLLLL